MRLVRIFILCFSLGFVYAFGDAQAPPAKAPATLTLEEAIRLAQANEPAFAAAAADSQATALERKDAKTGLLPSVVYHNQYLFTQSNHTYAATVEGGHLQSLPVFIANNAVHEYYSQASVNETLGLAGRAAVRLADANAARAPTLAFVMTNAGIMAGATLEGTKVTRIDD